MTVPIVIVTSVILVTNIKNEKSTGCFKSEDFDTHGFTASRGDDNGYYSFSYYTSDSLSEEDIHSMLKKFGF